jgi:PAS domain S-box-containing protein
MSMTEDGAARGIESLHRQTEIFAARLAGAGRYEIAAPTACEFDAPILDGFEAAIEELRTAEEELRQQSDELALAQGRVEQERRRYQELFDYAPDAYFVTDASGVIQEANRAAIALLGLRHIFVIGKPLAAFVARDQYQAFRTKLLRLQEADRDPKADWDMRVRTRSGRLLETAMRVVATRDEHGQATSLRWLVRDASARSAAEHEARRLAAELEQRVRERTAQLEAVTRVNQALLAQEQESRAAATAALARERELLVPVCEQLEHSLAEVQELVRGLRSDSLLAGASTTAGLAAVAAAASQAMRCAEQLRGLCASEGSQTAQAPEACAASNAVPAAGTAGS